VQDEGVAIYESGALKTDGSVVPLEVHAMTIDLNGEPAVVSAGRDVTERKQAQDTIARMAFYDALTGLANRALFFDRLQHAMDAARRSESTVAVAFLDLDHFKAVNDTLGHRHGDALLVDVANRLVASVRSCDTVARLGGDEFTVLFEGVTDEAEAMDLAERLIACFCEPFDLGDQELFITTSVGVAVAVANLPETSAEELVLRADTAMYHVKEQGRNGAQVFRHHMGQSARDRFALKNDLRFALERGEMSLYYQPQFRVADRALTGVEALLRWDHPTRGPVGPASFLPLAEESGQIVGIGAWVLREACARVQAWSAAGLGDLRVAVNLSTRQFEDPDLLAVVTELLAESGLAPERLELEVTESLATRDIRHMRTTFDGLRALGVRLAIDDFGTGHSSLDRVMQLNVDTLKLDRRFVGEVGRGGRARAICGAIIFLAHALDLNVIAEGVETDEQLLFLVENECDEMQGFLLGRPAPVPGLEQLLRDRL
jgi:diguanylate cyclase (GGDEF)-like protein